MSFVYFETEMKAGASGVAVKEYYYPPENARTGIREYTRIRQRSWFARMNVLCNLSC